MLLNYAAQTEQNGKPLVSVDDLVARVKSLAKKTEIQRQQCVDAAQNYIQNELTRKHGYEVRFTQGLTSNA